MIKPSDRIVELQRAIIDEVIQAGKTAPNARTVDFMQSLMRVTEADLVEAMKADPQYLLAAIVAYLDEQHASATKQACQP